MSILGITIGVAGVASAVALIACVAVTLRRHYLPRTYGRWLIVSLAAFVGVATIDVIIRVSEERSVQRMSPDVARADAQPDHLDDAQAAPVHAASVEVAPVGHLPTEAEEPAMEFEPDRCLTPRRVKKAWSMFSRLSPWVLRKRSKAFVRKLKRCHRRAASMHARRVAQLEPRSERGEGIGGIGGVGPSRYLGLERYLADLSS